MRYQDVNSRLEAHINTMRAVIAALMVLLLLLSYAWHAARSDIRIHIPPDLRSGAVVKADDIASAHVYAFAAYIFQQLNHWDRDGETNYGQQIFRMAAYLTPDFREYLSNDLAIRGKRGELAGRVRSIQPVAGRGYEERRVEVIDPNTWLVWLDFTIQETVRGMDVKQVHIRYPITVVRYDVDPELNPWGLALSGFAGNGPTRIQAQEQTAAADQGGRTDAND